MKKLLSILFTVFALTFTSESFAQIIFIKAGLNYSTQSFKSDISEYGEGTGWKPGFGLGATVSIPVTERFSLETGLSLENKGYNKILEQGGALDVTDLKNITNLYYLKLPLGAKARINLGKMKLFGVLGPSVEFGLWGKTKSEYKFRGEPVTEKNTIKWGSNSVTDNYTRFDFCLNAGAGLEFRFFEIGLGYGLGLLNITPDTGGGRKINSMSINMNLAYKLRER